jgi:hypothetical protein
MKYIELKCEYCQNIFKRMLTYYNHGIKHRGYKHVFCCSSCNYKYKSYVNTIELKCEICNKIFRRRKSEIRSSKSGKYFCSSSCAAIYNNKIKKKSRRSNIEKKLCNLLVNEFPNLNILPNDKTMLDGLEVDIAIPSLKLAIEWNGIVHFKPIYGQKKLNKVQNNDTKKLKIASKKNINLIVITDLVSNDKILQKAFNDVKKIINNLI